MDPFATPSDVEGMWRPLTDDEATVVANQLDFASAIIRQQVPTVDDRIQDGSLDAALVMFIATSMVVRSARNPDGWRTEQRQIDDYSATLTRDGTVSGGGIYLADDELALLAQKTSGAFSIGTSYPKPTHADLATIAERRERRFIGHHRC